MEVIDLTEEDSDEAGEEIHPDLAHTQLEVKPEVFEVKPDVAGTNLEVQPDLEVVHKNKEPEKASVVKSENYSESDWKRPDLEEADDKNKELIKSFDLDKNVSESSEEEEEEEEWHFSSNVQPKAKIQGPDSSLLCHLCGKIFASKQANQRHRKHVHEKESITCHICGKFFSLKTSFRKHFASVHTNEVFRCEYCHHISPTKGSLKHHVRSNHYAQLNRFKCDACEFRTDSGANLYIHKVAKHSKKE